MVYVIAGGVVIVVLVSIICLARPANYLFVSPAEISIGVSDNTTLVMALRHKGWFTSALTPVAGTINLTSPNLVSLGATTVNVTTTADGSVSVTGVVPGIGNIKLTSGGFPDVTVAVQVKSG